MGVWGSLCTTSVVSSRLKSVCTRVCVSEREREREKRALSPTLVGDCQGDVPVQRGVSTMCELLQILVCLRRRLMLLVGSFLYFYNPPNFKFPPLFTPPCLISDIRSSCHCGIWIWQARVEVAATVRARLDRDQPFTRPPPVRSSDLSFSSAAGHVLVSNRTAV